MKLSHIALFLTFLLLFSRLAPAQAVTDKKSTDDQEKLRKEAVVFLRDTMVEVNNLRTLENRISFSAELASLMWFQDEKEARSMYVTAFADFKQLLTRYDTQMNAFAVPAEGDEYSGGIFGEISDKSQVSRKFQIAIQVRQQIAMSLAEHDPELAFSFYSDSLATLTNPEFRKQMEGRDQYFEIQLMTQVAATNAAKATQFAVKSLDKGVNYQHIELLKKIYKKDPAKGVEFAEAILGRFKKDMPDSDNYWVISSFLNVTGESYENSRKEGGKTPLLTRDSLRDLADTFGQALLNSTSSSGVGMQYVDEIGKYAPSRADQIRAKFQRESGVSNANSSGYGTNTYTVRTAPHRMSSNSNSVDPEANARMQQRAADREKAEKELSDNVEKVGNKQLPKEERDKIVAQARKILLQTPGKDKKILGLSALAAQVAKAGDKELAGDIMRDAQNLVSNQPKNYQDFILTWMLASGYAEADPEKAFPLLEDTILRVNDTLAAFIKVGEFVDVAGEMIDDGEVQVGAFGGSMIRGMTTELGMADATLRTLVKADFTKTKNLTNRFDRPEVRILAKMMVLRAVLNEKKGPDKDSDNDLMIDN